MCSDLIELYFSSFTTINYLDLKEAAFARGSSKVMSDEANPSGKAHRVIDAGMEKLPVAKNVVINPVPT